MRTSPGGQTEETGGGERVMGKEGRRQWKEENLQKHRLQYNGKRREEIEEKEGQENEDNIYIYLHKKRGQEGKTRELRHTQRKRYRREETYRETGEDETECHGGVEGRVIDRQTDRRTGLQ